MTENNIYADRLEEELEKAGLGEEIWKLLWPYVADENADEDFSAEMAQRLCEKVLPRVWSEANKLIAEMEKTRELLQIGRAFVIDYLCGGDEGSAPEPFYSWLRDERIGRWKMIL